MARRRRKRCRLECEVMERRLLLSTYVVTSPATGPTPNTLRWAILQVNADTPPDTIQFDIPGGGVQSIQLSAPLPAIVNSVVIDGTTQPNYQGSPLIQLDGSQLGADSGRIGDLGGKEHGSRVVDRRVSSGSAIVLNSVGGNVVAGDYLGVLASGTQAGSNGTGISITGGSSNTIGGSSAGSANVISGNSGNGIVIGTGSGPSDNNDILGNLIGTTSTGSGALGNGQSGILVEGASGTQIGFPALGSGNMIAGNVGPGIELTSGATGTVIQNNFDRCGGGWEDPRRQQTDGILLDDAPQSQIGGTDLLRCQRDRGQSGERNQDFGRHDRTLGRGQLHRHRSDGHPQPGQSRQRRESRLVVEHDRWHGRRERVTPSTLTARARRAPASSSWGRRSGRDPLQLDLWNAGLGINLGDGPTSNHAPGTAGPNDYQNYPTLSLVQSDGSSTTIQGTLLSIPNTAFLLQFFASPTEDRSGFGQGKTLIGSFDVQTDDEGNVTFTFPIAAGTARGAVRLRDGDRSGGQHLRVLPRRRRPG